MNLDQLRDTFRQWQDAPGPKERNEHLKTLRAALTPTPVADDPVTAALAQVDPDAPDLQAQLRAVLAPARPTARRLSEIHDPRPDPLLSLAGSGALLSVGDVCMLSGEGGIAKSALAVGLAVDVANATPGTPSAAGPLRWHGGPADTLLVSYEDHAAHVAWRARCYAELMHGAGADLDRVRVLSLADPMFGPAESESGAALYNARPKPLPGWADVATAARETGARLIVIDPAGEAYAGEHNNVSAVREFLRALRGLAAAQSAGVIVIGHSTKAARVKGAGDPFDAGLVAGSAAWHDGVRGVLSLQWRPNVTGARDLVCPKSNHGPARLVCGLDAIRDQPDGAIVGFKPAGMGWHVPREKVTDTATPSGGLLPGQVAP